jgi:kynureninase
VVVTDTTSVNLFKALAAALQMQARPAPAPRDRHRTLQLPDRHLYGEGLTAWLDRGYSLRLIDSPEELPAAIGADTAVVMLTHVNYRTATSTICGPPAPSPTRPAR